MPKSVRLVDIAKRLNVSTVTVSNALAGQKGVSEDLREEIKALADEMGYRSPSAAAAQTKTSYNIGVIVSDRFLDDYATFYWKMYQELAFMGTKKNCFTMVEMILEEDENNCVWPKLLKEGRVEGLIVLGEMHKSYLEMLRNATDIPVVYLDFYDDTMGADAVISDNFYGMYFMTNYLFDMGHREIAYVGTIGSTLSITDRYFGYEKSLAKHEVSRREDWIIPDRNEADNLIHITLPDQMPTAFVCNCDLVASELIKVLDSRGYRVPEDISIVGFDNYLYPGLCDVGISTYEVDMLGMADAAFGILVRRLRGKYRKKCLHIISGQPVIKDSIKRIKR